MPKEILTNKFTTGVNSDINEASLQNTFMRNAENIEITKEGNQLILQKPDGIQEIGEYPEYLTPLAAKEFNNVIYFVSVIDWHGVDGSGKDAYKVEYGTYPSVKMPAAGLVSSVGSAGNIEYVTTTVAAKFSKTSYTLQDRSSLISKLTFDITNTGSEQIGVAIYIPNIEFLEDDATDYEPGTIITLDVGETKTLTIGGAKDTYGPSTEPILMEMVVEEINGVSTGNYIISTAELTVDYDYTNHVYKAFKSSEREIQVWVKKGDMSAGDPYEAMAHNQTENVDLVLEAHNESGVVATATTTIQKNAIVDEPYSVNITDGNGIIKGVIGIKTEHREVDGASVLAGPGINLAMEFDYYLRIESAASDITMIKVYEQGLTITPTVDYKIPARYTPNLYTTRPPVYEAIDRWKVSIDGSFTVNKFLYIDILNGPAVTEDNLQVLMPSGIEIVSGLPAVGSRVVIKNTTATMYQNGFEFVTDNTGSFSFGYDDVYETDNIIPMQNEYGPIYNYKEEYSSISEDYAYPFRTLQLGYKKDTNLSLELQLTYDNTINMITTDGKSVPRIVNTRTLFDTPGDGSAELVVLDGGNLSNVYSEETMDGTKLLPHVGDLVVDVKFKGVDKNAGSLQPGGYKYYFKLVTADGAETNIIAESNLVSIHKGSEYGNAYTLADGKIQSSVKFDITGINTKTFRFVRVYYALYAGGTDTPAVSAYRIVDDFPIDIDKGTCSIIHLGYDADMVVPVEDVVIGYTPIDVVVDIAQKNNRLLFGGTAVENTRNADLLEEALKCFVSKTDSVVVPVGGTDYAVNPNVTDTSYATVESLYYKLNYMPGETYEIGINYVFDSGAISPTYPIQGLDFTSGSSYNAELFGIYYSEFNGTTGQNARGVVRMKEQKLIQPSTAMAYTMEISTELMNFTKLKALGVTSFFFSRKKRKPDAIAIGLLTNTATVTTTTASNPETGTYIGGKNLGMGAIKTDDKGNRQRMYIPAPMCSMPFTNETTEDYDEGYDTVLMAAQTDQDECRHFAFYSPVVGVDPVFAASLFNNNDSLSIKVLTDTAGQSTAVSTVRDRTASGRRPYLYHAKCNSTEFSDDSFVIANDAKFTYVDDAARAFSDGSFTARADRLLGLALPVEDEKCLFTGNNQVSDRTKITDFVENRKELPVGVRNTDMEDLNNLFMINAAYAPYLGIEFKNAPSAINTALDYKSEFYMSTVQASTGVTPATIGDENVVGLYAIIYNNEYGSILPLSDWINKYKLSSNETYFAVSERISINTEETRFKLTNGDSFNGVYHQHVWRSGGIDGIPTATDPTAYKEDRSGTGLVDSGLVMSFYVAYSSVNFQIRGEEYGDVVEEKLYKSPRKYYTYSNALSVRGARRPEPRVLNYGNVIYDSINYNRAYDPTTPYTKLLQDNRVYVSDANIVSSFDNGYRQFKGINFRDYDSELGPIVALASFGLQTFIVYEHGVSAIEISERAAMQTQDSSNVYIKSAQVLPEKSTNILPFIGSQHKHSVISTDYGVTGVDADKKRIWMLKGSAPTIISEGAVQNILLDMFTTGLKDIHTSYDRLTKEVTYTFVYSGSAKSIIYNQTLGVWYGTSFKSPFYQFIIEKERYMLRIDAGGEYNLFKPISPYKSMEVSADGNKTVYEAYFDFVVKRAQFDSFSLDSMVIEGIGVPSRFDIYPEDSPNIEFLGRDVDGNGTREIPCYTNTFIPGESVISDAIDIEYVFKRNVTEDSRDLKIGDPIMLDIDGTRYQFVVANTIGPMSIPGEQFITVNKKFPSTVSPSKLYYGWKVPIRLSLMEYYMGRTEISVPTKTYADRLSGIKPDMDVYRKRQNSTRPSGKFVRVRFYFMGMDPIAIDSVISTIDTIYS